MYYFSDPERVQILKRVLDSWVGTPYRHWCGVKGEGCDCVHFVARVMEEIGYVKKGALKIPWYDRDWHLHHCEELLFAGVKKYLVLQEVPVKNLLDGDLLLFRFGRAMAHSAFYLDGHIYHAVNRIGVLRAPICDAKMHRCKKNLRLCEKEAA